METRQRLLAGMLGVLGLVIVGLSPMGAVAEIPCVCRYAGQYYSVGQCVCINRSGNLERACCDKVLNNTSWTFFDDGCPIATTDGPGSERRGANVRKHADPIPTNPLGIQRALLPNGS